ncbi:amino acid transporter, partial [Mycobacterium kansasii]
WGGKLFVLVLLGFAATDFIITITLSSSDAAEHIVENPLVPSFFHGANIPITLGLVLALGVIFLKGFREAIGTAVVLVTLYLSLNVV